MTDRAAPKKPRRSGSQKRQRSARRTICMLPDQMARLNEAANAAGLSFSSYVVSALLKAAPPTSGRKPPIERQALTQILGQLGRLNGNVNQIARAVNFGQAADREALRQAMADLVELRGALMAALGRGD